MASPVWFFVPNLIGYFRVVTAIASFFVAFKYPVLFSVLYLASFLADALDGHMARMLGQCSKLGAVLDMITDRFATAGLTVVLSQLYSDYTVVFILLNSLDLVSHYVRMNSTLLTGADSHKAVDKKKQGILLYYYYTNRICLGGLCLMNEFFYFGLYCLYFFPHPISTAFTLINTPGFIVKQIINAKQLSQGLQEIVQVDDAARKKGTAKK